jgi:ketosteroid isomerase-like protein
MNDRELIETLLRFLGAWDVEQILSLMSKQVVYQLYISQTALPYGGQWRGTDAVRDVFFDRLATLDCIEYEPTVINVINGRARCQAHYVYRHRASGETLTGTSRIVCHIKAGTIDRMEEYHDDALLKAFAKLANQRAIERCDELKEWKL